MPRDLKVSVVVVIPFIVISAWQWIRDLLDCLVVCASPRATIPDPSSIPAARNTMGSHGMLEEQKLQPEGP